MWWIIVILAIAGGCVLYFYVRSKTEIVPEDTYVCDICGEKHCICHKEEKP